MMFFENPVWMSGTATIPGPELARQIAASITENDVHNAVVDLEDVAEITRALAAHALENPEDAGTLSVAARQLVYMVEVLGPVVRRFLDNPEGYRERSLHLESLLRKHADHAADCPARRKRKCTCNLAAALAEAGNA
jgi:hypothetical protein